MTRPDSSLPRRALVAGGMATAIGAGLAACSDGPHRGARRPSAPAGSSPPAGSSSPAPSSSTAPVTPGVLETTGADIQAGPRTSTSVALTFHGAGDPAIATRLLDILHTDGAKATVFAVGNWATDNHAILERILSDGHDLGNHTWSHRPMRTLSAAQADEEIAKGAKAVAAVRGSAGLLFRPSGTPTSDATIRAAAAKAGYHRCISYDLDTLDYTDPPVAAIIDSVRKGVRGGSIVSLHFGHQHTVEALPSILKVLRENGFRPDTVTALLGQSGDPVLVQS